MKKSNLPRETAPRTVWQEINRFDPLGLSRDLAREGEPFGRRTAMSCVEWLAEPSPGYAQGGYCTSIDSVS